MSSSQNLPHPQVSLNSGLIFARSAFSLERSLLDVITGVDEGVLQEIPWESLPLTRVFVKERLPLTAFFSCFCSPHAGGPLWRLNFGFGLSLPVDDQFFIAGSNSVLGCNCPGWKEGAVSILSCRSKKDCDSLLREISFLNSVLGDFYCGVQGQDFEGAVQDLHNNFSRIALDFHNPR